MVPISPKSAALDVLFAENLDDLLSDNRCDGPSLRDYADALQADVSIPDHGDGYMPQRDVRNFYALRAAAKKWLVANLAIESR